MGVFTIFTYVLRLEIHEKTVKFQTRANNKETMYTTREEVCKAVEELKRKKCRDKTGWNNEMVLETGDDMIDGLLEMINKMEEATIVE